MDVVTKSVDAAVAPVESDFPGQFEVILSTETMDRDDENLWADEWKTPLPARIHIDGDHGRSLEKTVGSAVPSIDGNRMIGKGTYAGTDYAQMVRQLVNEGHINSVSVTYAERKNQKDGGVQRELLNAAFVAIPANPEAVVLASKSAKTSKYNQNHGEHGLFSSGSGGSTSGGGGGIKKGDRVTHVSPHAAPTKGTVTGHAGPEHVEVTWDAEHGEEPDVEIIHRDDLRQAKKSAKVGEMDNPTLAELVAKAAGGMSASGDNPDVKHDDMVQAIHDAAAHLGAQCLNEIDADPGTADGANKGMEGPTGRIIDGLVTGLMTKEEQSSSTKDAGLPQESAEESAAAETAEKSAVSAAADNSADDTAKANTAAKHRALAFLIKQNTPQEG